MRACREGAVVYLTHFAAGTSEGRGYLLQFPVFARHYFTVRGVGPRPRCAAGRKVGSARGAAVRHANETPIVRVYYE